jgi:hypothetical protein
LGQDGQEPADSEAITIKASSKKIACRGAQELKDAV